MQPPDQRPAIVAESLPPLSAVALIDRAIEKGITGEQLNQFVTALERIEDRRAAQAFADAITAFQAECPQIEKHKEGGRARNASEAAYKYAPYEDMMRIAGPVMVRHKVVATFTSEPLENAGLRITCRVRVGSHSELTTLDLPSPGGNSLVNNAQVMAMTLSYAKRYALAAALNIVTCSEDNDCQQQPAGDPPSPEECAELAELLRAKGINRDRFFKWASSAAKRPITTLEELPRELFNRAMANYGGTK